MFLRYLSFKEMTNGNENITCILIVVFCFCREKCFLDTTFENV